MYNILESIIWSVAILMLIGGGLFFSFKYRFIQFDFIDMFKALKKNDNNKISPFKSLTMALAARIGVGSLAGIALSIYIGGVGTIFWIWISSFITAVNTFSETILGMKYREKDNDVYKGGPSYYIDRGLNNKKLAKTYAVLILFAYLVGFMSIQANTISKSIEMYFNINPLLVGIILSIFTFISIIRGVKGIANLTSFIVPVMGSIYLFLSIFILIKNITILPSIFISIINHAFNYKSFGMGILTSFIIGIQRGVFSTEAGLGSGAIASSTTDSSDYVGASLLQVLGIYFTSFIICTSTALIILTSDYTNVSFSNINGIEITQYAFSYHLGKLGILILLFSIISFAFSTIISGYYYGESNLKYIYKNINNNQLFVLKFITIVFLLIGSIINSSVIWKVVDMFVAMMAIINMYSLFKLRNDVKNVLNNYKN